MKKTIENAVFVAKCFHADQQYGDQPYHVHLQAVHDVLVEFGVTDEDMLIAAWLHDILEDTDYPVRKMAAVFGPRVANLVWAVSGFGKNRKERADDTAVKIVAYPDAGALKCADRIANVRASVGTDLMKMYLKAWPDFKYRIAYHAPAPMYYELERLHS